MLPSAAALVAALVVALPQQPASAAGPRPAFQLPFPCGQKVRMESFAHAPALDAFRVPLRKTEGNPLVAPADGVVNQSYNNPEGAGNIVQIDHGGGWFTTMIHLRTRAVRTGDKVEQGDRVGQVGHTGESSNGVPHLHLEQAIDKNGDGRAEWGYPNRERVVQVYDGKRYGVRNGETSRVTSRNCGGDPGPEPPDPEPEPEPEKTTLRYTGPGHVANGTDVRLSARLRDADGDAVTGERVSMTLGGTASPQRCAATTDAEGTARCTVDPVDQPLGPAATVPLGARYAGGDAYAPSSDTATLRLQYLTGRAYGMAAKVDLPPLPSVTVPARPDTGEVRSASRSTTAAPCLADGSAPIGSGHTMCPTVTTALDPATATATTTVDRARLVVPGGRTVLVSHLRSTSSSRCGSASGSTWLDLTVGAVEVTGQVAPNTVVDLGDAGHLVLNEQRRPEGTDGLRVTGLRLVLADGAGEVSLASAASAAHHCPPA